jgi:choline dehydrogenase-like flavoprotein
VIVSKDKIAGKKYDLCVVGTGPAGIIVALEYARLQPEKTILLVEYGDMNGTGRNDLDDGIINHNPTNHHDPYECTNKGFGGSSATWGGRCVMYDPVDFVARPSIGGDCTWDETLFEECQPLLDATSDYFECGRGGFDLGEMPDGSDARIAEGFQEGNVTDRVIERWSMPTRFGARYREQIAEMKNLFLASGWEARDFGGVSSEEMLDSLKLRNREGGEVVKIEAGAFVLAAGTQETTRILLRNPGVFERRGGPPETLGRYYQGHVSGKIASVQFNGDPRKTDYDFGRDPEGCYYRRRFQFRKDFLVREDLLNTAIWLDNPLYHDPSHGSGAMSMMYLAMVTPVLGKRLAPPAIAQSITKGKVNKLPRHLWNVIKGLPGSLWIPASIFYRRYCLKRKLPGIFLYNRRNKYALHFHAEQIPDPENKMVLAGDGETLEIHYHLTDKDVQSVIRLHEVLDDSLRKSGSGKLEYWFSREELPSAIRAMSRDGIHQSGTTRIADDPACGVVDRDLRVWGTRNLYLCSSSVFPTSSQANPTFMLGVFALRLARHLSQGYEKS